MIIADVRIRAVVLTLFLVVTIATVVRFWPEQPASTSVRPPVTVVAANEQLQRHFDWATKQLRTGHFEQAINGFRAVLEQAPNMPEAHLNKGFAHIELKQYEQALHAFQTAIDLRPGQVNAYWGLAVSLEGLCDIAGAIGAMRTYVHLAEPDNRFLVKANAALWEWEAQKTAIEKGEQNGHECLQTVKKEVGTEP